MKTTEDNQRRKRKVRRKSGGSAGLTVAAEKRKWGKLKADSVLNGEKLLQRKRQSEQMRQVGLANKWHFDAAVAYQIVVALSSGVSLREFCKQEGSPSYEVVRKWREENPDFDKQFVHAKQVGCDSLADEALEIAKNGREDIYYDRQGRPRVNQEVVARSRLGFDAIRWYVSKIAPKVYGDKPETEDPRESERKISDKLASAIEKMAELGIVVGTRRPTSEDDLPEET